MSSIVVQRVGDTEHVYDPFVANRKQADFFQAAHSPWPVREVLFDGSIRGGKSQACCKLLVAWAWHYPGAYLVGRATYKELEDSTKRVMLRGEGGLPPACPPNLIAETYEGEKNKVVLRNGSEILFRSLEPDKRGKIRNITLAGAFIDQVEELEDSEDADQSIEDFYDELLGRLSEPNAPRKMLLAANPGPEDHWVCRRFGCTDEADAERPAALRARTRRIHVALPDNKDNLDPTYFADLMATETTRPDYFRRMVMGEWGAWSGKRFKSWNPDLCVYPEVFDIPDGWEIVEGLDWGYSHPFACIWHAIDYDGAWWAVAEHHAREVRISQHAQRIKQVRQADVEAQTVRPFAGQLAPSVSYLGPDAWSPRGEYAAPVDELYSYGIYCSKAWNERLGGWNRLDEMLAEVMPDGFSRLRFFPHLRILPAQIRSAQIKKGTDDIEKKNDDALDATRYALMTRLPPPEEKKPDPDDRSRAASVRRMNERRRQQREEEIEE